MKKAVQIGAGNVGRGFLGQLFSQSGYEVVFIEMNKNIIDMLNKRNTYLLKIIGENPQDIVIKNVRAVNSVNIQSVANEIKTANLMATAVGVNILKTIAPLIAEGIKLRAREGIKEPLNIIICENLLNAEKVLKGYVQKYCNCDNYIDTYIGFVESVVSRMIPVVPEDVRKKDPTFIMVEEYCILPVDKNAFKGSIPDIKGMVPKDNLKIYEEMKLFIHNLGHSMFAYAGYLKGYKYIWQAVEDEKISKVVQNAMNEAALALIKKHRVSKKEIQDYISNLLKRFANKELRDTIYRVGREPLRKLGPNDRLTGAAKLTMQYNIVPENISVGIASALRYSDTSDKEAVILQNILKSKRIKDVLKEVCGLEKENNLTKLIVSAYRRQERI